jgi:hypothetical protein
MSEESQAEFGQVRDGGTIGRVGSVLRFDGSATCRGECQ